MNKGAFFLLALAMPFSVMPSEQALCAGWNNPIEEDHQILESQLTAEAVEDAKTFLKAHPGKQEDVVLDFGVKNSEKILKGYGLKRAAETSKKPEDRKAFCKWLTKEGFWYD